MFLSYMCLRVYYAQYIFQCTCIVLLQLIDGVDVCPGAVPHKARVDVLLDASLETEARWLHVVTTEMDYVSSHRHVDIVHVHVYSWEAGRE